MNTPYKISLWAASYAPIAITLIMVFEFFNVAIGVTFGSDLLSAYHPFWLSMALGVLIFLRLNLKNYSLIALFDISKEKKYKLRHSLTFTLFTINLLAYTLAGGIVGNMTQEPHASQSSYAYTTVEQSKSKTNELRGGIFKSFEEGKSLTKYRILYFALFALSLILTYFGAYLACGLACSEKGFLAVMVFLLTLGVLAGGFYFFGRMLDKDIKPFREMTPDERKHEKRRYFRTLLVTVVILALLILLRVIVGA